MKKENVNPVVPSEEAQHLATTEDKKDTLHSITTEPAAEIIATVEYPLAKADDTPVPFATGRAFAALGDSGLRLESGVGEIVDNSIEANATQIDLLIKYRTHSGRKNAVKNVDELAVVDNGDGMDYKTIKNCLALGASMRTKVGGQRHIGRYGMGLPAAATSLAWRVEVYSRTEPGVEFLHVYLDFENRNDDDIYLSLPCRVAASDSAIAEYAVLLEGQKGTIVILKKFKFDYNDKSLLYYIGRTYRKFIGKGVLIQHNGCPIYLHDPLYMDGPTRFDAEAEKKGEPWDPKAAPWGSGNAKHITLEIPGKPEETANVEIMITQLPQSWYTDGRNAGGKKPYTDRMIHKNEGVSILRAGREVYDGPLSGIIGRKTEANPRTEDIDRWWGCEISFPPELDSYFEMRFIKNDIVPNEVLREKIRSTIMESIRELRKKISADRKERFASEQLKASQEDPDPIKTPEKIYQEAVKRLPKNTPREEKTSETLQKHEVTIESITKKRLDPTKYADDVKRAKKKAELSSLPLVVNPSTNFFSTALFYPEYQLDQIILNLNVKHPFYVDVMEPLFENWPEESEPGSDSTANDLMLRRTELKNALFLLLFSIAKGEEHSLSEADPEFHDELKAELQGFRDMWGRVLASTVREVRKKRGE